MSEIDSWLSHVVTGALAAIPGVSAWYLEWRKNHTNERHEAVADRRSAVDELSEVVRLLQGQVDRMEREINELRARAESAEEKTRLARDESHQASTKVQQLYAWMQQKNYDLPPTFKLPEGAAHA